MVGQPEVQQYHSSSAVNFWIARQNSIPPILV
jgi:hypothetical protein